MAHNYARAIHGESNYLPSVVAQKGEILRVSHLGEGDGAISRKRLYFCGWYFQDVPAGNANGIVTHIRCRAVAEYASESAR